jgi:hypothetical protein
MSLSQASKTAADHHANPSGRPLQCGRHPHKVCVVWIVNRPAGEFGVIPGERSEGWGSSANAQSTGSPSRACGAPGMTPYARRKCDPTNRISPKALLDEESHVRLRLVALSETTSFAPGTGMSPRGRPLIGSAAAYVTARSLWRSSMLGYAARIRSREIPAFTDAATSWTGTRVPRMTGNPPRIAGSETTTFFASKSSRCLRSAASANWERSTDRKRS